MREAPAGCPAARPRVSGEKPAATGARLTAPVTDPRGGLFSPFEIFFFAFHFHEFDLDAPGHDVL